MPGKPHPSPCAPFFFVNGQEKGLGPGGRVIFMNVKEQAGLLIGARGAVFCHGD